MPEKVFKIFLNKATRIIVYLYTEKGEVINFVVKLEFYYSDEWLEVERYDCYHGQVHKDILDKKGKKTRTINYPLVEKKSGFNFAINDFKENHKLYVWRFLNE